MKSYAKTITFLAVLALGAITVPTLASARIYDWPDSLRCPAGSIARNGVDMSLKLVTMPCKCSKTCYGKRGLKNTRK
jgi:hypothetical protein